MNLFSLILTFQGHLEISALTSTTMHLHLYRWTSTTLLEKEWHGYLAENSPNIVIKLSYRTHDGKYMWWSSFKQNFSERL